MLADKRHLSQNRRGTRKAGVLPMTVELLATSTGLAAARTVAGMWRTCCGPPTRSPFFADASGSACPLSPTG